MTTLLPTPTTERKKRVLGFCVNEFLVIYKFKNKHIEKERRRRKNTALSTPFQIWKEHAVRCKFFYGYQVFAPNHKSVQFNHFMMHRPSF